MRHQLLWKMWKISTLVHLQRPLCTGASWGLHSELCKKPLWQTSAERSQETPVQGSLLYSLLQVLWIPPCWHRTGHTTLSISIVLHKLRLHCCSQCIERCNASIITCCATCCIWQCQAHSTPASTNDMNVQVVKRGHNMGPAWNINWVRWIDPGNRGRKKNTL